MSTAPSLRPSSGLLIPPSPLHRGDPTTRHAELTVYALGADQDAIVPCLEMLGDFNRRELLRFQHSLPVTITLPACYYDKSNAFVKQLRLSGTTFKIVASPWLCPKEIADEHHWCTSTCPVMEYQETISS